VVRLLADISAGDAIRHLAVHIHGNGAQLLLPDAETQMESDIGAVDGGVEQDGSTGIAALPAACETGSTSNDAILSATGGKKWTSLELHGARINRVWTDFVLENDVGS
jgi:hypothetical protein